PAAAVALAEKAVKSQPFNAAYATTLGVALYRVGRHQEAINSLKRGLEGGDRVAVNHYFLAMSYRRLGQADKARGHYRRAGAWRSALWRPTRKQAKELATFRAEAATVLRLPAEK